MNKLETFESFLVSQSVHVPIFDFIVNLFLAALVSHLLSLIYVRYGGVFKCCKVVERLGITLNSHRIYAGKTT